MRVASLFRATFVVGISAAIAFVACGPSNKGNGVDATSGGGGGGGGGGDAGGIDAGSGGSGSGSDLGSGSGSDMGSGSDLGSGSGSDTGSGSDGSGGPPNALGTLCTPGTGSNFQGSCPTNYVCLSSTGVGSGWCTFTCSVDADCQAGYTSAGDAKCSMTVQEEDGSGNPLGSAFTACGIFCANGSAIICDPGTCNGTCPTGLSCTQDVLEDGSDTVLGSACEMN